MKLFRGRRADRPQAAFTVFEVVIATSMLALIFGGILMVSESTRTTQEYSNAQMELQSRAYRTVFKLRRMIKSSGLTVLAPQPTQPISTSMLEFQQGETRLGSDVVWGNLQRISLVLDPGEILDGIDNDGDAMIDESHLRWEREIGTPQATSFFLARNLTALLGGEFPNGLDDNGNGLIDEEGFCAVMENGRLIMRMTLQKRTVENVVIEETVEGAVLLAN